MPRERERVPLDMKPIAKLLAAARDEHERDGHSLVHWLHAKGISARLVLEPSTRIEVTELGLLRLRQYAAMDALPTGPQLGRSSLRDIPVTVPAELWCECPPAQLRRGVLEVTIAPLCPTHYRELTEQNFTAQLAAEQAD